MLRIKGEIMKKILSFFLLLILSFTLTFSLGCRNNHSYAPVNKVILFIGDGMGENHIKNTELYYDMQMSFTSFETKVYVDTKSLDGVTDSAASATAMATGVRVENELIAIDSEGNNLTTISELAKRDEYGVGVVTTDETAGATPAGFSSHANSRTNSAAITLGQIKSPVDLILGSGGYGRYFSRFEEYGFNCVTEYSELSYDMPRIYANFYDVMPTENSDSVPNLVQLTTFAINFMEENFPGGYFLMIEGAKIDKASHSNDITFMMQNLYDFSNAIATAKTLIKGDYAFIVTADHETGGLKLAQCKEDLANSLYTKDDHTDIQVPLYYYCTTGEIPSILNAEVILNTQIFDLCHYLLAIK